MNSDQLIQVQDLVNEFYSKPFYFSYSGLNRLLYSPSLFYKHYILQEKEEKLDSYLIDGKIIHCLLLDDGSFNEQFILIPSTLPTENTRRLVDAIYERVKEGPGFLADYSVEILEYLKEVNLHQSLKTDQQRLDKILTDDAKSYFEFLKVKGNKILIDSVTLERCNESVEVLMNNSQVCELLGLLRSEMDNVDVYNEIPLQIDKGDFAFGLKGILDNIKVDHAAKIIYINDLKTTAKTITDFPETVEFYNYWLQAAIYCRLVGAKFSNLVDEGYKMLFNFIVIDKYNQVYAYEVSDKTMLDWDTKLIEKMLEAAWHYNNRSYILPKKFMEGKVYL